MEVIIKLDIIMNKK